MSTQQAVSPNYRYWQEHGREWVAEYAKRKRQGAKYHIVELMIADYMLHHAPATVLEYGCGTGRHLKYLSRTPGIDIHGYDQSPTMIEGIRQWASPEWFAGHVTLGEPIGRLPYDDAQFDIVYTASVLVHIRPEDLPTVLREMARVCRGHLLHLESRPTPGGTAFDPTHDGCWRHDIVAAYRGLGLTCHDVTLEHSGQGAFRVVVGGAGIGAEPRFTWSPVMLALYEQMKADLDTPA